MGEIISKKEHAILKARFPLADLEFRPARSGISKSTGKPWVQVLTYVTARAIMDRLDEALGPSRWESRHEVFEYKDEKGNEKSAVECILTIHGGVDDSWHNQIVHCDVSELSNIEDIKGGYSGSLKRVAVRVGIGRYLYQAPTMFAEICERSDPDARMIKINGSIYFWRPPYGHEFFSQDEKPPLTEEMPF